MDARLVLFVFMGGGIGSVLRYLVGVFCAPLNGHLHFPVGTLCCNVLGCFLIGCFNAVASRFGWSEQTRLMLTVGLCGGFTTFSTMSNESLSMLNDARYLVYFVYTAISIVAGLLAVWLGSRMV